MFISDNFNSDNLSENPSKNKLKRVQETFKFKPPVYASPLGFQYTQPILYSAFVQQPMKVVERPRQKNKFIQQQTTSMVKVKRSAAIQGVQSYKKKKKQVRENDSYSISEEIDTPEPDPHEKLLDRRESENGVEYLVKFRNLSYLHCKWISESEIKSTKLGALKLKKYKYIGIDENYITVDRVIQEVNLDSVLVKWKGLPYEFSTFEYLADMENVKNFEEELLLYRDRKRMRHMRYPIEWRPIKEKQLKFTESPKFKKGNTLRTYQLEGLNWLLNRWYFKQSCIMADEMGLGKTVQSVSFINALYTEFDYYAPAIVVAPLSTIGHWEREFANWTDLRVLVYHGTVDARNIISDYEFFLKSGNINVRLFDVIITTYEMAMAGAEHFSAFEFGVGIFDEAHRLKNPASKAAICLSQMKIFHKVLLSGTPIQNNLNELWALFNFLDPFTFNNLQHFLTEYKMESASDVDKLQALLKPIMLRRMKEDVETSIPSKEETIIEVELTTIQKRYYRAILEKNIEFLTSGDKSNSPNLLNAMMELRKCCIHPYLLKGAEESIISDYNSRKSEDPYSKPLPTIANTDEYYNVLIHSSGKLVLLDKLLNKLQGKHKVLIFSQMTKCLDLLTEYLQYRNFKYERIDGGVRGDLRQAAIDRFSSGEAFVFLLCTRAGGVGINLTAADTCIIFDSDWNPQNDLQAQARCHRIGQKNQVKIYRLITKNSYEREMFDKAGMKLGLDRAILQKMSFTDQQVEKTNKKEDAIQLLLRKGAYGVLMDTDDDANKFCEEDIDQILERRTKVIKHEDGGNAFSKATFQVEEEVEDPNFWENLLSHKKLEENEGRVKRQVRKLARDGNISDPQEVENLYKFYTSEENFDSCDLSEEERDLFILFLDILANGLENIDFDLFADVLDERANTLSQLIKYCLDLIPNEKNRKDYSEFLEKFNVDYEVELFEKQSEIYLKYHEPFLFRIQIPIIMSKIVDENCFVDKGRGFSQEDDKLIIKNVMKKGYSNFTIKEKSVEDINQRVRKIINILYHKKEVKENDNAYFKTILHFGRVTSMNENSIKHFLKGNLEKLNEIVTTICEMTRRARRDTPEADCYERIVFFDKLANLKRVENVRRSQMPKNWSIEDDEELKDFLLTEGFSGVYSKFKLTEDVVIKRFEQMFKIAQTKEEL